MPLNPLDWGATADATPHSLSGPCRLSLRPGRKDSVQCRHYRVRAIARSIWENSPLLIGHGFYRMGADQRGKFAIVSQVRKST